MGLHLLWFVGAAGLVVVAGVVLSRTADAIAERTGLGRLAVGVVLLAGATTLPEIVTDLAAIRMGLPDLAVGDILGSCLMNLLILGFLDLAHHLRHRRSLISEVVIGHARAAVLSMILLGVAGVGVFTHMGAAIGHVGLSTLTLVVIYALGIRIATRHGEDLDGASGLTPEAGPASMSLSVAIGGFCAGAIALVLAGPRLALSGEAIAEATGLGATFFGTVFLALVTSLPELVASITALHLGAHDLAVGNILGSNVFNVALLFVFDVAHRSGPLLAAVAPSHALTALVTLVVTGLVLLSLLTREEKRVWLVKPDACAIVGAACVGVALLYVYR